MPGLCVLENGNTQQLRTTKQKKKKIEALPAASLIAIHPLPQRNQVSTLMWKEEGSGIRDP